MVDSQQYDVVVIGGGIAGLSTALRLPERMRVALITKGAFGEGNTRYAQGGIAVAVGEDDTPDLHFQDTLAAGADLCNEESVRVLVEQGPAAVRWLIDMGVQFDRIDPEYEGHATADGLLLGREAAHSRWRVLHAGGDATGAAIERALVDKVRKRTSIDVYKQTFVKQLILQNGVCTGVAVLDRDGRPFEITAGSTILASGGAGGLWLHTSNPAGATADGLALAWQAGAELTDLEFMQFHPTVLAVNGTSHLISEAVRGEGGYLRNHAGERFMPEYHPLAELAPRDVVARAILSEMLKEQVEYEYLDLSHLPAEEMYKRFPTITALCRENGLDLAHDLLPVAPAAHYCMGGVKVDPSGHTSVVNLYAVGEVACTGVHGANRLASNSLLEGLVYGLRVADHLAGLDLLSYDTRSTNQETRLPLALTFDTRPFASVRTLNLFDVRRETRQLMWRYVSLQRDRTGLLAARERLEMLDRQLKAARPLGSTDLKDWLETTNMLLVAQLVITVALQRRESRGSHWRVDAPTLDESLNGHHYVLVPEIDSAVSGSSSEVGSHA